MSRKTSEPQVAGTESDLERLQKRGIEVLRDKRPARPPMPFYLVPLLSWIEDRHMELLRENGFPEARRAFNPVFIHLPADGCRLTELAARAHVTKQAMGELVDELVELGYLRRFPDPADRRAKIILRSEKGIEIHFVALDAFAQIDRELEARLGTDAFAELREVLGHARRSILGEPDA